MNKSCKFLCFPLFAFPSHLSSAALHHSHPNPPLSPPPSPSQKARVKTTSFPQPVNQSYKLKPCSQHATRNENLYVRAHACKCMCTCVKTLLSHQSLHLVAEGVEGFGGNPSGNGNKLQVFSSFNFLFQSPPQLSAFSYVFFP